MEDFSDTTNRNIILIVMFIFYLYIKYKQTQIMIKKKIKGVKCNPLEMIVGDFMGNNDESSTFSQCMSYATSEDIINSQNQLIDKNNQEYQELINDISNNIGQSIENTETHKQKLLNLVNKKIDSIDDLIVKQNKINKAIAKSDTPIGEIAKKIGDISTKFKDVINNFKKSDMITKMKDTII